MNVKQIIIKHLEDNNFEGLFNTEVECGCEISDLMPCDNMDSDCQPDYKIECTKCNIKDCEYENAEWCIKC